MTSVLDYSIIIILPLIFRGKHVTDFIKSFHPYLYFFLPSLSLTLVCLFQISLECVIITHPRKILSIITIEIDLSAAARSYQLLLISTLRLSDVIYLSKYFLLILLREQKRNKIKRVPISMNSTK